MAKSCCLRPSCRNKEGKVVPSKLFDDIYNYTNKNRKLAKELYSVAISQDFLSKAAGRYDVDENGQITLDSLLSLSGMSNDENALLNYLNRAYSGVHAFGESMDIVSKFNKSNEFRDKYLAVLDAENNENFKVSVVRKTAENKRKLTNTVKDYMIFCRVKHFLREYGADIKFIDQSNMVLGRYSTKNPETLENGLYHLIDIANGVNIADELCEQAGHFVLGALDNDPLVERLVRNMSPENIEAILGKKMVGEKFQREAAGVLIGDALRGQRNSKFENLINRILLKVRHLFHKLTKNKVKAAMDEARLIASDVADGFTSYEFKGTIDNAIGRDEEFNHNFVTDKEKSANVKLYEEVRSKMQFFADSIRNYDYQLYKAINETLGGINSKYRVEVGKFTEVNALTNVAQTIYEVGQMLDTIKTLLDNVHIETDASAIVNLQENAANIICASRYIETAQSIIQLVNSALNDVNNPLSSPENIQVQGKFRVETIDLKKQISDFNELINNSTDGYANTVNKYQRTLFLSFLKNILGKEGINRSARILWNTGKNRVAGKGLLRKVAASNLSIAQILDEDGIGEDTVDVFNRFWNSFSRSNSIVIQLLDKQLRLANKMSDDLTIKDRNRISVLREKLREINGNYNTEKFYETTIDFKTHREVLTGNFIDSLRWGDWERDKKEIIDGLIKQFIDSHDNFNSMTIFERRMLFEEYSKPMIKEWYKRYAHKNSATGKYEPSDLYYHNDKYDTLSDKEKTWLKEVRQLKDEFDSRLTYGSAPSYRIPQFKKSNRLTNIFSRSNYRNIWEDIYDTFTDDADDSDYGSDLTINNPEEDFYTRQRQFEKDKINRIPLFGINKMKDMRKLSTDLFYNLACYSGMCNRNLALNNIVGTMEIGQATMNHHDTTLFGTNIPSNIHSRQQAYADFMRKKVYNIGVGNKRIGNITLNRIGDIASSFMAIFYLGYNVHGAAVNAGTGFLELFKEAASGEFYNLDDFRWANQKYGLGFSLLKDIGQDIPTTKLGLIMQRFNTLVQEQAYNREPMFVNAVDRVWNVVKSSPMALYSVGDMYMQTISYLALMHNIKLYSKDPITGEVKQINLYDAYEQAVETESGKDYTKIKKLNLGRYLKDKNSFSTVEYYQKILDVLNKKEAGELLGATLSPDQLATLAKLGYRDEAGIKSKINQAAKVALQSKIEDLYWNEVDESNLMDKARDINNTLHGIYNKQDKNLLQQTFFLRMFTAMKGYLFGTVEGRYGSNKYSVSRDTDVEGFLNSWAKMMVYTFTTQDGQRTLKEWLYSVPVRGISINKERSDYLKQAGFSDNQIANMTRSTLTFFCATSLLAVNHILKSIIGSSDDKDEDKNKLLGYVYYLTRRLEREQSALYKNLDSELSGLVELPLQVKALSTLAEISYLFVATKIHEDILGKDQYIKVNGKKKIDTRFYLGSTQGTFEKGTPKYEYYAKKRLPILKCIYVYENGKKAADSFGYLKGKNSYNK